MPIMIPNGLPAAKTLAAENIFVMTEMWAVTQDIRPLQILVLNLMPTKIATETQLSRLLGNTPLQVELELIHTDSHESKNTSREHLLKFYQTFEDVKERWFDGLIITGAPVEQMPFEQVEYWPELCRIMEWSRNACAQHVPYLLGCARQEFIITTASGRLPCPKNSSASIRTGSSGACPCSCAGLTMCSWSRIRGIQASGARISSGAAS